MAALRSALVMPASTPGLEEAPKRAAEAVMPILITVRSATADLHTHTHTRRQEARSASARGMWKIRWYKGHVR